MSPDKVVNIGTYRFKDNKGPDLIPYIENLKLDPKFKSIMETISEKLVVTEEVAITSNN